MNKISTEKTSALIEAIRRISSRDIKLMEVCGTHTVSIFRHGIRSLLPENIRMISGPGCPVCVTDQGDIDAALEVAGRNNTIIATYGDMLRVPGTDCSLSAMRADGKDIRIITSARQCMEIARDNPDRETVFFAVGFETTSPSTAAMILEAQKLGIRNLSVMSLHKKTPPVLAALASNPELDIDGFILPGHVSVILGHEPYDFLSKKFKIPSCIAGFEAEDILLGIFSLLTQISSGTPRLSSVYPRAVREEGNIKAKKLLTEVFEGSEAKWRGLGAIPDSGLSIRNKYASLDAYKKLGVVTPEAKPPEGCRCGDVLSGRITPLECPLFDSGCNPATPVGPCMVSSEGACSAYYKFRGGETGDWKI